MKKKVIVIGAGIAGIAVAIRLALKGHDVDVYEKNTSPGGKLSEIKVEGYRFDAGPSLFTLPELVNELFILARKDPANYFSYKKLDEICNYFFEDGTRLTAFADTEKFCQEVKTKTGVDPEKIKNHLQKSRVMYDLTEKLFLQSSLHKLSSYFKSHSVKALLNLGKLKTGDVMHKTNSELFGNQKITQIFDRYATYNGSDPYKAPATLNIIPHLEYNLGAYFPLEGMYSIITSLVNLATEEGVKFHYNSCIDNIVVKNKTAVGIQKDKKFSPADIVISNIDISVTYRKLLKSVKAPSKILNQEKSSSAIVFYWGMNKEFSELGLHNIFFTSDYKKEFQCLFDNKIVSEDPTIYLNISSKQNKKDAPQGCENWFTMINVPANTGQDWDVIIEQSRKNILAKLSRLLKQDVSTFIQVETILDPRSIEQNTSSEMGALYGNSSNNQFSAFLRHPNFSNKIKNLYFCGGSVHPGGGIPLCLFSAKIVSEISEDC